MTRRGFLGTLGIATVGLYLRLAPNLVRSVPAIPNEKTPTPAPAFEQEHVWEFPVRDFHGEGIGRFVFQKDGSALYQEFIDRPYLSWEEEESFQKLHNPQRLGPRHTSTVD